MACFSHNTVCIGYTDMARGGHWFLGAGGNKCSSTTNNRAKVVMLQEGVCQGLTTLRPIISRARPPYLPPYFFHISVRLTKYGAIFCLLRCSVCSRSPYFLPDLPWGSPRVFCSAQGGSTSYLLHCPRSRRCCVDHHWSWPTLRYLPTSPSRSVSTSLPIIQWSSTMATARSKR